MSYSGSGTKRKSEDKGNQLPGRAQKAARSGGQHHHQQEDFQGGENSLLLAETEEILNEAGRQLHDGRRLLEETQEVGAGVLGDLHTQRETIQRSRSRLK